MRRADDRPTYDDIVRRVTPLPDFTHRASREEEEAAEHAAWWDWHEHGATGTSPLPPDPTPDEAAIAAAIREQFAEDHNLAWCDLGVDVRGREVLITGTAVTEDDRLRAIAIAREVRGVERVVVEVSVKL